MSSTPPPAKRLACDRCHVKKIRCMVQRDSKICGRCQRQGLSCNFSPPAKTGRPAHSKMRRTNTAPSPGTLRQPTAIRHRPSQTLSAICPSDSMSMSSSPAPFVPVAPRTPSLETNFHQTPIFSSPSDYAYPLFDGPIVVEPQSFIPSTYDTDFFNEHTPGLLTPISYEGSCSPMTTMSSLSLPYLPLLGTDSVPFGTESPMPMSSDILEAHGLNLNDTLQELSEIESSLPDCAPGAIADIDCRTETLLRATDRVHSLLSPYFTLSLHASSIAQSIESSAVDFMIGIVIRLTEAYRFVITPGSTRTYSIRHPSEPCPPSTRAISPSVLSIQSPMPMHASPLLQPTSTSIGFTSPIALSTTPFLAASPMEATSSITASSPALAIAPAMSVEALPAMGPSTLGGYISNDPELNRWMLANFILFQLRVLSKLQKRMEVCLSFCSPPQVAHSLEELNSRLTEVKGQVMRMVQQTADEDY